MSSRIVGAALLIGSSLAAVAGCGGAIASESDKESASSPDEVRLEKGLYSYRVETVSDTCTPARVEGVFGDAILHQAAAAGSFSIPLPWTSASTMGHPYQDVPVANLTSTSDCQAMSFGLHVQRYSRYELVVDMVEVWDGSKSCSSTWNAADIPAAACSATRRLTFQWKSECPANMTCP
ncbi:hypothetical protein AKJ09_06773 [Labilithrix luteola]|uniref:Lipoprotein n=1 Tax=Labilithrix luteola TaxID=1391654 RepID=A0A0K1Q3Z6_9BACT|nr:hypothetical protein [Labilithrix luteola]AKV00110.1 hypothetical protein AKJ09_06773 [Labilithrix luteola]